MSHFHITGLVRTSRGTEKLCYLRWLQIDPVGDVAADWHPNPEKRACFPTEAMAKAVASLLVECGLCMDANPVEARS